MSVKILKKVDIEVVFPDGRVINGFAQCYPESTKQVLFQLWDNNGKDSHLVNLHLAESISLRPTFEGE